MATEKKNKIIKVIEYVFLGFAAICFLMGLYYFTSLQDRDKFPELKNTVNEDNLLSAGFKKVEYDNGQISLFVPNYWVVTDDKINAYGDILNGSSVYVLTTLNSLGPVTDSVCGGLSEEVESKLQGTEIYSNLRIEEEALKTINKIDGCYAEYSTTIEGREYIVKSFFVLREIQIYQVIMTYRKDLKSEEEISESILNNLVINI